MDGEPPDLPADQFSEAARNFVSGCLNKIPKLRPTYAMLLQHAWLAQLLKPPPILEEDEDLDEATPTASTDSDVSAATIGSEQDEIPGGVVDKDVADWVKGALEKRRSGKMGKKEKPALHAAPLDVVSSPEKEIVSEGEATLHAEATNATPTELEMVPADQPAAE